MKFRYYATALTFTLFCLSSIHGEYLVVKRSNGTVAAVTQEDANATQIYETLLKYQWPTCLATIDELSQEKQNQLFADKPSAEESMIRHKLQELDKSYDTIFVPTVLYELFCLLPNILGYIVQAFPPMDNRYGWNEADMKTKFAESKEEVLNFFYMQNKKEIVCRDFFIVNEKLIALIKSINAIPQANNSISQSGIAQIAHDLISQHQNQSNSVIHYLTSTKKFFLADDQTEKNKHQETLLCKIAKLENDAQEKNNALLFRGLAPFEGFTGTQTEKLLDSPATAGTHNEFEKLKTGYKSHYLFPRSLSYGNSCFAGIINDITACAYYYLGSNHFGYTLSVSKKEYVHGNLKQLFFIAPLSTLNALYASGELFHPRTRSCNNRQAPENISGLVLYTPDKAELILFTGDPLKQISKIISYINKNNVTILLGKNEQEINFDLSPQERAAQLYQKLYVFERLKQSVKSNQLKRLEELCLSTYAEHVGKSYNFPQNPVILFDDLIKTCKDFSTQQKEITKKNSDAWINKTLPNKEQSDIVVKKIVPEGSKILFFGDTHGSIHALLRNIKRLSILGFLDARYKLKEKTYLIFLGDYVDLGCYEIEVLYTILKLYLCNPNQVIVLRGNHEDYAANVKFGFKANLEKKYQHNEENSILLPLINKSIYANLPVALFIGCNNNFIQCCHGGIAPTYNPQVLLSSKKEYQAISRDMSNGFTQSYFEQYDETQKNRTYPLPRPNHKDGYQVNTREVENLLKTPEYQNVKAFFRAHQHSYAGLKMLPAQTLPIDPDNGFIKKAQMVDNAYLPYWKDVLNQEKNKIDITQDGFPIAQYSPVFTFSSAPEGASYPPKSPLNFDCFGILTVAKNYEDWRLIPYEIPLDPDRDNQYVKITPNPKWTKESQLLDKYLQVHDCITVNFTETP